MQRRLSRGGEGGSVGTLWIPWNSDHLDFEMQEKGLVYLSWTGSPKNPRHAMAIQNIKSKRKQN